MHDDHFLSSAARVRPSASPSPVLPHHKLLAYAAARELLLAVLACDLRDPKLRDEATRSAKSACLNCAEGAGRVTRAADRSRVKDPSRRVHVADREGDIYELLTKLVQEKRRFISRAAQSRTVFVEGDDVDRLFDAARQTPQTFALEVPLSRRIATTSKANPPRGSRVAKLSFAALSLQLREPKQRSGAPAPYALRVNVVHVFELGPPAGEKPVEWILLTSEPIDTREDIERIVEGYRTRWTIEEYFKAIKTGCAYESRQLESFHGLANMLAYTLVVAYALLLMRALSRTGQEEPASALLEAQELAVLRRKLNLSAEIDVRTAARDRAPRRSHQEQRRSWLASAQAWMAAPEGLRRGLPPRTRDFRSIVRLAMGGADAKRP